MRCKLGGRNGRGDLGARDIAAVSNYASPPPGGSASEKAGWVRWQRSWCLRLRRRARRFKGSSDDWFGFQGSRAWGCWMALATQRSSRFWRWKNTAQIAAQPGLGQEAKLFPLGQTCPVVKHVVTMRLYPVQYPCSRVHPGPPGRPWNGEKDKAATGSRCGNTLSPVSPGIASGRRIVGSPCRP